MKIALLQSAELPFDKAKLNYYLNIAKSEGAKLFVLPEYVLNRFFKEIEKIPLNFVKEQSNHQLKLLKKLSLVYNITILAPLVVVKGNKKHKAIVKCQKGKARFYYQQIYMPYNHWNEESFFDKKESKPLIFTIGNVRIASMFGFESHFTPFWDYFAQKKVDLVVLPSVGTFNSKKRWFEMLKTFAFIKNIYVARVNRVGEWNNWQFYGNSFVINPDGELVNYLGEKEELLISAIDKKLVKEARKEWKFNNLSKEITF
ncbi:hydrolase, carbon-nitrogen family [Nautilia profundicola AmH]|uniref:Hydrolase, carbon-nitrogen family n=1 Tax=Nautilia profundicola (strain ATCC BAA-1463 / DSM 18972 / AmH) TaxID=598659 RepID=B9L9I8_NAUPA|nr:carbon-nitrogen hydrolase family protein [Nautilia profundicola]ACM92992.1 hydrolase, carbon-nitrogen family [Nautilia profundicola AmH]